MSGLGILGAIFLLLFGWLGVGAPTETPAPIEPQAGEHVPKELKDFSECMSLHDQDFEQCKHVAPNGADAEQGRDAEANASGDPVDVIIN